MGFSHGFFATLGSHGLGVWAFCDLRRKAEFCETHVQKTSQLVLVSRLIEGCCDMRFPAKRDDTTKVVPFQQPLYCFKFPLPFKCLAQFLEQTNAT